MHACNLCFAALLGPVASLKAPLLLLRAELLLVHRLFVVLVVVSTSDDAR
jgi:hypothetical protein